MNAAIVGVRGAILLLATLFFWSRPAAAADCDPATIALTRSLDASRGTPESYDWQGAFQETVVCYPSRQSGAELAGYLFAPADVERLAERLPIVVIGPGSGTGRAYNYLWSARELASHGYLVLVGDPQGVGGSEIVQVDSCGLGGCPGVPYQQTMNYVDGLLSQLDFVFSRSHPWLQKADLSRVGMAGHSLSARATSYIQGIDVRVGAIVAWDNLTSDLYGDAGISSGGGVCGSLIGGELPNSLAVLPRVPALGEASDAAGGCTPLETDPDIKKTAYDYWRGAGTSAMQLVFREAAHGDWAQTSSSDPDQQRLFQYYTRAWFDLHLKGEEDARERLLAREVLDRPLEKVLSTNYRSAIYFAEARGECPDLIAGFCALALPGDGEAAFGGVMQAGMLGLLLFGLVFRRTILPALAAMAAVVATPAQAFQIDADMAGHVSYVHSERIGDGDLVSEASTPAAAGPRSRTAPDYPTSNLWRSLGGQAERKGCRSCTVYIPSDYEVCRLDRCFFLCTATADSRRSSSAISPNTTVRRMTWPAERAGRTV